MIPPHANGDFVAAMEATLDLYCQPYDPLRPVVCIDEQPRQLTKEVRVPIPAGRGRPARVDYEYTRNGTANIFMAVEPLRGIRHTQVTASRDRQAFAHFVAAVVARYPHAKVIRLVLDNLNTHSLGSLYETFPPEEARRLAERIEIHYTPKHGSWLNMAEIELSALTRQCLDRRIGEHDELAREVAAWELARNRAEVAIDWPFTTADARIRLKRLYPVISPVAAH